VRLEVPPIRGAEAKFSLDSIEELLINDPWIKSGDGHRFYGAVPFPEIIFEHSDICFIAEDPINMVAGEPLSLSGSKPVVVKDLGDFFVTDARSHNSKIRRTTLAAASSTTGRLIVRILF
jgi:hypothetical protein